MAGKSSKASTTISNMHKYNGKEKQANEFSDGGGLESYDYGLRMYDGQIERWWQINPKVEKYPELLLIITL